LALATFRTACDLFFNPFPYFKCSFLPNPNASSLKCDCPGCSLLPRPQSVQVENNEIEHAATAESKLLYGQRRCRAWFVGNSSVMSQVITVKYIHPLDGASTKRGSRSMGMGQRAAHPKPPQSLSEGPRPPGQPPRGNWQLPTEAPDAVVRKHPSAA
jgi:hypothetical protein